MQINVFQYTDYKRYLRDWLTKRTPKMKGGRSRMAEAMGSKHSYLSRVLNEDAHLSLEQGEQLNVFLGHTEQESHFFLLVLSCDRAGSPALKTYYKKQIERALEVYLQKLDKHSSKEIVSAEHQNVYYSEWHIAAVHMFLLSGMGLAEIAAQLGIHPQLVSRAVEFLMSIGLVVLEKGKYRLVQKRFRLNEDSPYLARHHANWRLQAIRALEKSIERKDLHGTVICSIAGKDLPKIKLILSEAFEKVKGLASESGPDDTVACVNYDVFKL